MNRIRYFAAALLCLTGVIHVARLGIPSSNAAFVAVAVVLGLVYLAIGGFLFLNHRAAYYLGAIVPLVGLGVGLWGGMVGALGNPSPWMAFLGLIDAVIGLSCLYLIKGRRSP